jgi:Uma2 family endonuclease
MAALVESPPLRLHFPFVADTSLVLRSGLDMANDADFFQFCQDNADLRIERSATGELNLEMPTKSLTSERNALLTTLLGIWALQTRLGKPYESSGGFRLPSGAIRSPDAAFIFHERLQALTDDEREGFLPLAPDFIVELRSETDRLSVLQEKMVEWRDSGVRLGLLIDPTTKTVEIYRPGSEITVLADPIVIHCSPELPGFELNTQILFAISA